MDESVLIGLCFFVIAVLYSTVGHAGASGYLATMALFAFAPDQMKPAALVLNIMVALVASVRFYAAGYFSWRFFWPFAIASAPLAYLGGGLVLHTTLYKSLVGVALVFAAVHLLVRRRASTLDSADGFRPPGKAVSMATGGVIGFVSGLTGVGGGIFLSPVMVSARWAGLRQTSAVAAVFILINSAFGLLGLLRQGGTLPDDLPVWAAMVIAGGLLGSSLGATRFNGRALRLLLGLVLIFAGLKLIVA